ncbi:unnamed protein product [Caenorhabditis angaria]|uniref:Kringle domain-containing protein n=1 Tax=Caenorhabditis angaria TaxID=860376 RepID=A0A9P1MY13_9PELO|nr:unnamed protein product [Caenorhabditis angaria]
MKNFLEILVFLPTLIVGISKFQQQFQKLSLIEDCVVSPTTILKDNEKYYRDEMGNVFCYRKQHDGSLKLGSTSRSFADPRFLCAKGEMNWYRGRRNVAFDQKPCEFWNTSSIQQNVKPTKSFSSYSMRRFLLDEYENFCRNPDDWELGPWCWTRNGGALEKTPCFQPCSPKLFEGIFICLNKWGFPYKMGDFDLTDIMDLPELVGSFKNVQLQFENRRLSDFPVFRYQTKTCVNSGKIAENFGPWIAVLDGKAQEFIRDSGRRTLWELCTPEIREKTPIIRIEQSEVTKRRVAIQEDEITAADCTFWRQCFSACQDDTKLCWKKTDSSYFGAKKTSKFLETCLPWTKSAALILNNKTDEIYRFLLFDGDPQNYFVENRVFLNTENFCMNFRKKSNSTHAKMQKLWNQTRSETSPENSLDFETEFEKVFQNGPGCFVQKNEKLVIFESCFQNCESILEPVKEPKITQNICKSKKSGKWDFCKNPEDENALYRGRRRRKPKNGEK